MASNRLGGSDTQASRQQAERKGRATAEYKKVKENMDGFIKAIQSIPDAVSSLTTKFMEAEWLPTYARDITARNLITQALNRIENDADEHQVFLQMIRDITGTDQILTMLNVIQEESSPIQTSDNSSESTDTSAIVRSKHAIVSGKKKGRPANCPTMMKKASSQTECDSGYPVSTPDKMPTDVENMFEQPPGSFTAGVLPRLLNSGANVNFIPEGPQEGDVEDTTAPVPTSPSGSITTEAQQPRLDAADDPPSGAAFTIGPSLETVQAESDEIGEQVATTSSPMTATLHLSQSAKELAAKILSTDIINELDQIDELREENEKLKRQLKEEMDKREALRQEKEELNDQFTNYQKSVMEKEEADKTKLLEKEKQLEECRKRISEMELEHKTTCAALEAEIASLKQKMDDEKKKTELEMLRLENKLYKAEKELADKENVILVKEKEIEVLDKKIALDSKDAEIQKLKNENKALRRGQSLSRSLSSLRVSEEDDNSANPE